jgi:hypothetical protein
MYTPYLAPLGCIAVSWQPLGDLRVRGRRGMIGGGEGGDELALFVIDGFYLNQ